MLGLQAHTAMPPPPSEKVYFLMKFLAAVELVMWTSLRFPSTGINGVHRQARPGPDFYES